MFYGFITFLTAISGIVWFEPAPVDLLTLAAIAFLFATATRVPVGVGPPVFWLTLFLIANIIGVMGVAFPPIQDVGRSLFYMGVTIYLLLAWFFFTCVVAEDPHRALHAIWRGWLAAALLSALLVLGGYFRAIPGGDFFLEGGRGEALFKDPNVYGPFLIPPLLYLIARFDRGVDLRAILRVGAILLLVVGVMLGFSRAAMASMIVAFIAYFGLRVVTSTSPRQMLRSLGTGIGIAVLGVLVLAAVIMWTEVGSFFFMRMQLFQQYDVGQYGRFGVQLQALQTAISHPLGIGPGQSELLLPRATHNLYLRVATENGWLGALGFFVFLALTMWRGLIYCLRPGPFTLSAHIVYASLIGALANSVVIDSIHWRHLFLLLGMMWGIMLAHGRVGGRLDVQRESGASGQRHGQYATPAK